MSSTDVALVRTNVLTLSGLRFMQYFCTRSTKRLTKQKTCWRFGNLLKYTQTSFSYFAGPVAKYCIEHVFVCVCCVCVCVCVCVCLSLCPREYLRNHKRDLYQIFVNVAYGRGSVLLRSRCNTLCTFGFVDDIMFFFYNGLYSDMNFAAKDRFRLNVLIYRKIKQNSISYY